MLLAAATLSSEIVVEVRLPVAGGEWAQQDAVYLSQLLATVIHLI